MNLARYHSRSPRYILQPQDNTLIRVAGPRQLPWEEGTEIRNISLTGLAFTAPTDLCPIVGELIKIQFQVPAKTQMACFGLVTRLEPLGSSQILVGVQFQKLEMPHRLVLLQGLAQRLKEQQQQKQKKELKLASRRFFRQPVAALLMLLSLALWGFIYFWTAPKAWLTALTRHF
jgi:hypothetical protein